MNGSSWFLARELPSTCPTLFFMEIQVPPKTKVLSRVTLSQTQDFATTSWRLQRVRSTQLDVSYDKLATVVGRTMLTILATVDRQAWPVYRTERLPLCTTRCRQWGSASRGSVATADTCFRSHYKWHLLALPGINAGWTQTCFAISFNVASR